MFVFGLHSLCVHWDWTASPACPSDVCVRLPCCRALKLVLDLLDLGCWHFSELVLQNKHSKPRGSLCSEPCQGGLSHHEAANHSLYSQWASLSPTQGLYQCQNHTNSPQWSITPNTRQGILGVVYVCLGTHKLAVLDCENWLPKSTKDYKKVAHQQFLITLTNFMASQSKGERENTEGSPLGSVSQPQTFTTAFSKRDKRKH